MIKFGIAVVRGSLAVAPITRLKVYEGGTALHVVADALSCTSVEAEEDISRLEAFTSFAGEGKTALSLDDLQEPSSSCKADHHNALCSLMRRALILLTPMLIVVCCFMCLKPQVNSKHCSWEVASGAELDPDDLVSQQICSNIVVATL